MSLEAFHVGKFSSWSISWSRGRCCGAVLGRSKRRHDLILKNVTTPAERERCHRIQRRCHARWCKADELHVAREARDDVRFCGRPGPPKKQLGALANEARTFGAARGRRRGSKLRWLGASLGHFERRQRGGRESSRGRFSCVGLLAAAAILLDSTIGHDAIRGRAVGVVFPRNRYRWQSQCCRRDISTGAVRLYPGMWHGVPHE